MNLPPVKPAGRPPTPADIAERDTFAKLAADSLADVRAAADKWRGGLAALVGLVTGGLLIKGPSAASDLTTGWLLALSVLAGAGIGTAIVGLWWALKASAGVPRLQDFDRIIEKYGNVAGYQGAQAAKATETLKRARIALMVALPLLGASVIAWWWSGTKPPSPPAYMQVDVSGVPPACGVLKSADNGHIRLQVAGEEDPRTIPLTSIANVLLKSSC